MPKLLYRLLMTLVAALLPLKLWWRGRQQPGYRLHWRERYGYYPACRRQPVLWVHAVSVGETRAAQPLIQAWLAAYPADTLLLTHGTPTGRDTGAQLFAAELAAGRVLQAYLPVDTPGAVRRFLRHYRPAIGVLMETELWFELILTAQAQATRMVLASARLSARSARGYARLGALTRQGLQALALVAAQTEDDAQRLRALGATQVMVCGNLKFDVSPPADSRSRGQALRQLLGLERTVVMAASTRDGEEAMILDAVQDLAVLTLLVPRHPQRFAEVEALLKQRGLRYVLRTALEQPLQDDIEVVLGNSMGEMYTYYAASDLAVMGGSLQALGGQNLIEPASLGVPTILGPSLFNFAQVAQSALQAGAALGLSADQPLVPALRSAISQLKDSPAQRRHMAQAALALCAQHGGSTQRLLYALQKLR